MSKKLTAKQIKYFGTKAQRARLKKTKPRGVHVARRKSRRSYSRTVYRRARKAFSPTKAIMGGIGYSVLMPMMASKIPLLNQPMVRLAGGYMLAKKSGIIGDVGKAALYIEIANMASGFSSGGLSGVSEAVINLGSDE